MPHSVLAVANEFLERAQRERISLTPMHLQKLCYMVHGFSLAFLDGPLIRDRAEAWAYGPVYQRLYDALKRYGSGPVTDLIHDNNWADLESVRGDVVSEDFSASEAGLIDQVFVTYAKFPAFKLSALTHEDGSPWQKIYTGKPNVPIPDELMREYFLGLAA